MATNNTALTQTTTIEGIQTFVKSFAKIDENTIPALKAELGTQENIDMLIDQLEVYIDKHDKYEEAVIITGKPTRTTLDEDGLTVPVEPDVSATARLWDGLELTQDEYDEYFDCLQKVEQIYYGLMD